MQKVIFFDVDGTLLCHENDNKYIPKSVIKQMKRLQKLGYLLFIASGRPYAFISKTISDFGFDGYVLCNGAHVEIDGKFIFHQPMQATNTKKLIDELKTMENCEYIIETSRYGYLNPKYHVLKKFFMSCDINEDLMSFDFDENEVYPNALKLEVSVDDGHRHIVENHIKDVFSYDCHGTDNAFEIYAKDVSKATGVKKVLEYLQIPLENSYAYGDGLNDLEMLQVVGHGVAMGNAVEELKAVADEIIGKVDEDGLALALEKLK